MTDIKIFGRIKKNKNLYFCVYNPLLLPAIENFKKVRTVKVLRGIVYISFVSLGYFTEILANKGVPFTVITTLN